MSALIRVSVMGNISELGGASVSRVSLSYPVSVRGSVCLNHLLWNKYWTIDLTSGDQAISFSASLALSS